MSVRAYRRGVIVGLTIGETFLLLAFVLALTLLYLEPPVPLAPGGRPPAVVQDEQIQALREELMGLRDAYAGAAEHARSEEARRREAEAALASAQSDLADQTARLEHAQAALSARASELARERSARRQAEADADTFAEDLRLSEADRDGREGELRSELDRALHARDEAVQRARRAEEGAEAALVDARASIEVLEAREEVIGERFLQATARAEVAERNVAAFEEEVQDLRRREEALAESLGQQTARAEAAERNVAALEKKLTAQMAAAEASAARARERERSFTDRIRRMEAARRVPDPGTTPAEEALRLEVKELEDGLGRALSQLAEALQLVEVLESEAAERDALHRRGPNPSCWYRLVDDGASRRERPEYLVDVKVLEGGVVLSPRAAPPGGAQDGGSYAEERSLLGVAGWPYGRLVSPTELDRLLAPVLAAGREARVRPYPCVFYARIWDATPSAAKLAWKTGKRRLERWLHTFEVRDAPWPGAG